MPGRPEAPPRLVIGYHKDDVMREALDPIKERITGKKLAMPQVALNANSWIRKGDSLRSLGQHEDAVRCYDQALAIEPQNQSAWSSKGFALHNLGRLEEAIRCCDEALAIEPPQIPEAEINMGFLPSAQARRLDALAARLAALINKGVSLNALGRRQ